jgi:hypothetical protein
MLKFEKMPKRVGYEKPLARSSYASVTHIAHLHLVKFEKCGNKLIGMLEDQSKEKL